MFEAQWISLCTPFFNIRKICDLPTNLYVYDSLNKTYCLVFVFEMKYVVR
jgi:hypothetical protein